MDQQEDADQMGDGPDKLWHQMDLKEVMSNLHTSAKGLVADEAKSRIEQFGLNELAQKKPRSVILRFLDQFKSVLIIILIIAGFLSFFIGEWTDSLVIFIVITINACLSLYQEMKAEKKMEALKRLADPTAVVVRDGKKIEISTAEIVPGDIITVEDGQRVPVDARIISSNNLEVNESSLTGESEPVRKKVGRLLKETVLAERTNMLYTGTIVTKGNAKAVVVDTGMRTQIGQIAKMVQGVNIEETPLQKRLAKLGGQIAAFAIIVCVVLLIFDVITNWSELAALFTDFSLKALEESFIREAILTYISLAVAVIPEGLPVVVMLTLALGMEQMAKHNSIVKRMPCVETLGCTTVICSDKTGTLTCNEMTVKEIDLPQFKTEIMVNGLGYDPKGNLILPEKPSQALLDTVEKLMEVSMGCNNAVHRKKEGMWQIMGDPTEGALVVLSKKYGQKNIKAPTRVKELPFDADRMRMSTIHKQGKKEFIFTKGAPGKMFPVCNRIMTKDGIKPMSKMMELKLRASNTKMAGKAYRVLALAYNEIDVTVGDKILQGDEKTLVKNFEKDLIFIGLVGIIDPAREEAKDAISECKRAGIKVVMITGDQKETAVAIGKTLGIVQSMKNVLKGSDLECMSSKQLESKANDVTVYARASPEHKMKIISALKSKGHVVAMTGDGVNDAPALTKADIGVAMGQTGTDVAQEAADMVLQDDNFATIVKAVEEGRKIYTNIRRFIRYQLSTNVGAIILILLCTVFGLPIPLSPAQILYINIIMDGPPAMALTMEPSTGDIMKNPPRDPKESILSTELISSIIMLGVIMAFWTMLVYWLMDPTDPDKLPKARTMAFTTFVLFQLFNVLNCRAYKHSVFQKGLFANKYIIGAIALCLVLQIVLIYGPMIDFPLIGSINLFQTVPLDWKDWIMCVVVSAFIFLADEIRTLLTYFIGRRMRPLHFGEKFRQSTRRDDS